MKRQQATCAGPKPNRLAEDDVATEIVGRFPAGRGGRATMPAVLTARGVSSREAEVLGAVAEHLSNAEIAAQLFISVRTVESHVSSLLRKLHAADRRALARMARSSTPALGPVRPAARSLDPSSAPVPLTPFVGRVTERAALADGVARHRLVTVAGPGGAGKTRLALSVMADVSSRYADGVRFVDLVPARDGPSITSAIADAVGLGEHQMRSAAGGSLSDCLRTREILLVFDNCEHVLEDVVVVLERLLARCPGLTVLATSRSRLAAPFEWVFRVSGLSIDGADGRPSDAVAMFKGRAASSGVLISKRDLPRVEAVCRTLAGLPLAIELAAARLPSLGLDGVEAGLSDQLSLLSGAPRLNPRHGSLRATLHWSHGLVDACHRAVLRRTAVFAAPFSVAAAVELLTDWAPVGCASIHQVLADLTDHGLTTAVKDSDGTRYHVTQPVRQYAAEQLVAAGESTEASMRHLRWCLAQVTDLSSWYSGPHHASRRVQLDHIGDEVRAALDWAAQQPQCRSTARELAFRWAELAFVSGPDSVLRGNHRPERLRVSAFGTDV